MLIRLAVVALCLAPLGISSVAEAAPASLSARQRVLSQAVEVERQTLVNVIEVLRLGVERGHLEMSADSVVGYNRAKVLNRESRQLHAQAKYRSAYQSIHHAYRAMRPVMTEVLEKDDVPRYVVEAVANQIADSAQWIETLAGQIEHAPEEARASYQRAVVHYERSRTLYDDKKQRAAFSSWNDAMGELDQAVSLTWPEVRRH